MLDKDAKITKPIPSASLGYMLVFDVASGKGEFGETVARGILEVLRAMGFTGRCEYYARNAVPKGPNTDYIIGLGLRNKRLTTMPIEWWNAFKHLVQTKFTSGDIRLVPDYCEYAQMKAIRHDNLLRGVILMTDGANIKILSTRDEDGDEEIDSPFLAEVRDISVDE